MEIQLATNTVQIIGENVTDLMGSFSGVITLIIGMLVAFFIIGFIIDTIRGDRSEIIRK